MSIIGIVNYCLKVKFKLLVKIRCKINVIRSLHCGMDLKVTGYKILTSSVVIYVEIFKSVLTKNFSSRAVNIQTIRLFNLLTHSSNAISLCDNLNLKMEKQSSFSCKFYVNTQYSKSATRMVILM